MPRPKTSIAQGLSQLTRNMIKRTRPFITGGSRAPAKPSKPSRGFSRPSRVDSPVRPKRTR